MKRVAFKMKLLPGKKEEYKKRHILIWPELIALLKASKISDYSIFLDEETNTLFAVQKTENKYASQDLGNNQIVKDWWKFMSDIMETNPDNSPISIPLEEVFHLD